MMRSLTYLQNRSPLWWIVATSIAVCLLLGLLFACTIPADGVSNIYVRLQAFSDGVLLGLVLCTLAFVSMMATKR